MTTGTIIDIVIAAILLLAVIIGAIKGLFKTIMGLVATIVAIIAAVYLSGVFAGPATDYLYPRYEEKLQQLVSEPSLHINIGAILSDATDKNIDAFMNLEIPDDYFEDGIAEDVLEIAKQFGMDESTLRGPLENALKTAQGIVQDYLDKQASGTATEADAQQAAEDAAEALGKSFLKPVVRALLIIILFIVIKIILKILVFILNKAVKSTDGVKTVNSFGGAVLNFAETAVVMYILLYIASKNGLVGMYQEQLAGSFIIQLALKFIP